eukprot:14277-Pleurochrysis_carterae.AAC.1
MKNGATNGPLAAGARGPIGIRTAPSADPKATRRLQSKTGAVATRVLPSPLPKLTSNRRTFRTPPSVLSSLETEETSPSPWTHQAELCAYAPLTPRLLSNLFLPPMTTRKLHVLAARLTSLLHCPPPES